MNDQSLNLILYQGSNSNSWHYQNLSRVIAGASQYSDQSLPVRLTLDSWLSTECPANTCKD